MIAKTNEKIEKRYALSPDRFRRQLWYLKWKGYTPISLDDLHKYFVNKTNTTSTVCHSEERSEEESRFLLTSIGDSSFPAVTQNDITGKHRSRTADGFPKKPVVITFDDGYMDNYENAFPILKKYGFPATVFIIGGLVGNTNSWMKGEGYPGRPLLGWSEIRKMQRNGVTIGSHTVNHCHLTKLSLKDAEREIEDSKKFLEDSLGTKINHFAYPYGDMNESIINMVKESGYETACSTRSGFNSEQVSLHELRRVEIYGTDTLWQFSIKLTYGTNDGNLLLPAKYYMKRLSERLNDPITQ